MGVLFSSLKKKKDVRERLEEIDKELKYIYRYQALNRSSQQALMSKFIWYSFVFSVIYFLVVYLLYFPSSLEEQIKTVLLYIVCFMILYFLKLILQWLYSSRINRKDVLLKELKQEKEQLLDDVLENEKFKVAKEILEKFAPEKLRDYIYLYAREIEDIQNEHDVNTVNISSGKKSEEDTKTTNAADIRQRSLSSRGLSTSLSNLANIPQKPQTIVMPMYSNLTKVPAMSTPALNRVPIRPVSSAVVPFNSRRNTMPHISAAPPQMNQPLKLEEKKQSYMDLFIEMIAGEGPRNRYALICQKCHVHNGMAIKEEFEFISFRCVNCHYFNPSRRSRPPIVPSISFDESAPAENVENSKADAGDAKKSLSAGHNIEDKWRGSSTSLLHQTLEEEKEDLETSSEEEVEDENSDNSQNNANSNVQETQPENSPTLIGKETSL